MSQPNGLVNMARAVAGALPFVSRGSTLPARTVTVSGLTIDPKNVAEYVITVVEGVDPRHRPKAVPAA